MYYIYAAYFSFVLCSSGSQCPLYDSDIDG